MHVQELMDILKKADPAAPVRFWIDDDTEVDLLQVYDDECPDDAGPDELVTLGADCINIDLEYLDDISDKGYADDEIPFDIGPGDFDD